MPVRLDRLTKSKLDVTGAQKVALRSAGASHMRLIVLLSVRADNHKLPPLVVLNRKRYMPELDRFKYFIYLYCLMSSFIYLIYLLYRGCLKRIYIGTKSWIDDEMLEHWLRRSVLRDIFGRRNFLVWDSLRVHNSKPTKKVLEKLHIDLSVIPGI